MNPKLPRNPRARSAALLTLVTLVLGLVNAMAYDRIFFLTLKNDTNEVVTFTILPGSCYEGTGVGFPGGLVHGPLQPGQSATITVARVQGNDCDGEQGEFAIKPSTRRGELQQFDFDNEGGLSISNLTNRYSYHLLSQITGTRKDYEWQMVEVDERLSGPVDERLSMPRNPVAQNFGIWDGGSEDGGDIVADTLEFRKNGFRGFDYQECFLAKQYHTQHIVRAPNKNGHAYFVVANSDADIPGWLFASAKSNGSISVYKTDAAPDPVTDIVPNNPGTDGEIVWEAIFDENSRVGMWNHPCKMEMIGSLLVVSQQHFAGTGVCRWGNGDAETLTFFDMRDPEQPKYWGKIVGSEMGSGPYAAPDEMNNVTISHQGDWWVMTAGWWKNRGDTNIWPWKDGNGKTYGRTFITKKVSPNIEDWIFVGKSYPQQHGGVFNSLELYDPPGSAPPGTVTPGVERTMFADGAEEDSKSNLVAGDERLSFYDFVFDPSSASVVTGLTEPVLQTFGRHRAAPNLFPSKNDYDSNGPYVTPRGMVIMYAPLEAYPDCCGGDEDADKIYQVWHPDNLALQAPAGNKVVFNTGDQGSGSLRNAIAYGGHITFDPSLSGKTILLSGGPLMVSLHDVQIDASALQKGITLRGVPNNLDEYAPLIQITNGNTITLNALNSSSDLFADSVNSVGLPWATGGVVNWFDQDAITHDGRALQSGAITDDQQSYAQSAVTGPGMLTFWWKVSSEANSDFLRFDLDSVEQAAAPAISGDSGWQQKTVSIPAGNHQLRWTYSKDVSDSSGADAAYLDQVIFTPNQPTITSPLTAGGTQGLRFTYQIFGSGSPSAFATSPLPAGLSFNSATGLIDGSPTVSGVYNVTIFASNAGGFGQATLVLDFAATAITLAQALDVPADQPIPFESYQVSTPFFGQSTTTHDGVDAAQSAAIGNSATSDFVTYVYGPGTLTFWWKVSSQANSDYLRFHISDQEVAGVPGISGEVGWQLKTVPITTGAFPLRWIYEKDGADANGADAGWVDQITFLPSLAQAMDTPNVSWTTSGNANWYGQTVTTHAAESPVANEFNQRDAAQSGDVGDSEYATMQTNVTGPATLSFWWKVSSESGQDFLRFILDSALVPSIPDISGEVDWVQKSIAIPAGSHNVRWHYFKNGSQSIGADAGWVDQVILTNSPHTITSSLAANGAQGTPFSYQVTAVNAATSFAASLDPIASSIPGRLPPGLSINSNTGLISGTPTAAGAFNLGLKVGAASHLSWWGSTDDVLSLTVGTSVISNMAALDASNLTWTTGGNGSWYGQSAVSLDSVDAARSSGIGNSEHTYLESTVAGPGVLTYWWKVSSQENSDFLIFDVDGVEQPEAPRISGEVDWQQKTVFVPHGQHTLRWTYAKDSSLAAGADAGWVDDVNYISGLVTQTNGFGAGTLRQVLADLPAGATVGFATALDGGSINLGGSELLLAKDVTIDASTLAAGITVDAGNITRVFRIASGMAVLMNGISITGGQAYEGGGILIDDATLTLDHVTVWGNNATLGGGITNLGTLRMNDVTISGNTASSIGGGIYNINSLLLTNSAVSANSGYEAGGMYNDGAAASASLKNVTVSANEAAAGGCGLENSSDASLDLVHTTISRNKRINDAGSFSEIVLISGTLTLENCIIGPGSAVSTSIGKTGGTVTPLGVNFIGSNNTVTTEFPEGPLVGTSANPLDPQLAPAGAYGGATATMPPLPGSPIVDVAIVSVDTPAFDQRGQPRLSGSSPDLGSVEAGPVIGVSSLANSGEDSLRAAIATVDHFGRIAVDPSLSGATLALSSELLVDKGVTIDGNGAAGIILSGNNATRIFNVAPEGSLILRDLTLANGFIGAAGGAITNSGITSIENCTLTGNAVNDNWGGAIFNDNVLNLTNTTFTGNSTGIGSGGAVFNANGILTIRHSTFSGNTATNGGGIYNYGSGQIGLANSIVAGNSASTGPDILWNGGPITTEGVNLIGNTANSGISPSATVLTGDPRLAPPGAYGGPTPTMPPLPGSRAIEGAAPLVGIPPTDQRGNPRPSGPLPDLGAVEAGPFPLGSLADTDNDGIPDILEGPTGPYPQFTAGIDDRALDSDGDGSTDAEEFANMTNPNDPNDYMRSLSFGTAPGFDPVSNPAFMASFATFPGLSYDLEFSSNLMDFTPILGSEFTAEDFSSTFEIQLTPGHGFVRMRRK